MVMKSKPTARRRLLFTGLFNFGREVEKLWAYAYSGRQAKIYMMRQIAKKHSVIYSAVANIFNGDKDNFDISVDEKWKESHNV
mgnify:CR=1 FL=1